MNAASDMWTLTKKFIFVLQGKASSWLEGQSWEVVSKQLVDRRHGTETLAARLHKPANRIQLFRENSVM